MHLGGWDNLTPKVFVAIFGDPLGRVAVSQRGRARLAAYLPGWQQGERHTSSGPAERDFIPENMRFGIGDNPGVVTSEVEMNLVSRLRHYDMTQTRQRVANTNAADLPLRVAAVI